MTSRTCTSSPARTTSSGASWRAALWSLYLGGHFFLDAAQRWAILVGIDAGGSRAGGHFRLRWGLRARIVDDWFVGIYPLNPTYTAIEAPARPWSYPSGVELGVAF